MLGLAVSVFVLVNVLIVTIYACIAYHCIYTDISYYTFISLIGQVLCNSTTLVNFAMQLTAFTTVIQHGVVTYIIMPK